MSFKTILVPFDNSKYSKKAFKIALNLAEDFNSKIIILACINTFSANWFGRSSFEEALLKKLHGKLMNEIKTLEQTAKKKNVLIIGKIKKTPSISNTILEFSKKHPTDVIVMGARGHSKIGTFFLGSVSNNIINHAKCPVLIIR